MTTQPASPPSRPAPTRSRDRRAPGMAPAALLLAALTLNGCGATLFGHRIGFPGGKQAPRGERVHDAIGEAREQSALAPREPYWPYRVAQLCLAADSAAQAESALETALERDRSYAPALSLLSKLYFDSGRHSEAVRLLESARSSPGGFPGGFPRTLLVGLALHYDALGQPDQARAVMAELPGRERGARSAEVYLTLRGPGPDAAAEPAGAALREDPRSAVNQNNYGVTRLRAGDPEAARRAFQSAIELDAKLPGPYYNLAILEKYYLLDDEAAAKWFRLYRERSSDDPDGLREVFGKSDAKQLADKKEQP